MAAGPVLTMPRSADAGAAATVVMAVEVLLAGSGDTIGDGNRTADKPLQSVTFGQVLELFGDAGIPGVTLGDLDPGAGAAHVG